MGSMNNQPDMPPVPSRHENPQEPATSLWATWSPLAIIGLILVLMISNVILQGIFYALTGDLFVPAMLGAIGGVILPLYILIQRLHLPFRYDFSLDRTHPWVLVISGLVAIAALAPTSLLAQWSLHLQPPTPEWLALMDQAMPTGALAIIMTILTVVVVAPLAEELLFRGLLHRLASRHWGPVMATVISALFFGLIHGEPWYLFGLVGIGVVLALVYEATGSILACWVTHMVHNAVSLGLMLWTNEATSVSVPITLVDALIAGGSLVFLVLLLVYLFRAHRPTRTYEHPDQT
jgi:membrane protease YdiL (CAAX protease family)